MARKTPWRCKITWALTALACNSEDVVSESPPRGAQLSGTVLTAAGAPVEGARVRAQALVLMPQGPTAFDTLIRTSDALGRFSMAPFYYGFFIDSVVRFRVTVEPRTGSGLAPAIDSVTVVAKRGGLQQANLTLRVGRLDD
ncbi:MAG: hypothetical protein IPK85_04535 [Gemmatimonadetes bacterium]|nr:hypothetical protein [Gemmatimonadota bacterium]